MLRETFGQLLIRKNLITYMKKKTLHVKPIHSSYIQNLDFSLNKTKLYANDVNR